MERNRSVVKSSARRAPSGAALLRTDVTQALTAAFFEEWRQRGYAALSLEAVAKRGGVGKAALYRRWPDKAAMASDLLGRVGVTITAVDDQGSLLADVRAILLAIRRVLRHPVIRRILTDLIAQSERSPKLSEAIKPFQQARRARAHAVFDRAIAREEIHATIDRELAADLFAASLFWRMVVLGERVTRSDIERLSGMIVTALRSM